MGKQEFMQRFLMARARAIGTLTDFGTTVVDTSACLWEGIYATCAVRSDESARALAELPTYGECVVKCANPVKKKNALALTDTLKATPQ